MVKTVFMLVNNWNNGVVMIAIFAVVCLALVGVVVNMMMSGKSKEASDTVDVLNDIRDDDYTDN
ncbi:hypothetical protein ITJ86_11285 [Winogradskyella sp. F6397]|uniref:Uncharacterized protein n=1 Tax=Winogradskyella marina TaxID=2785530 RepID=A0ABS0EJP8_9FLAO|nr:hypothetical protein [Winogradskyella marina]MBF8150483.1 hypothetical protein [Winogradskyella marina]